MQKKIDMSLWLWGDNLGFGWGYNNYGMIYFLGIDLDGCDNEWG